MNKKRFAGAGAIIIGILLTWEAAIEANTMFMIESIGFTLVGMCYALPAIPHMALDFFFSYNKKKSKDCETKSITVN